MTNIIVAVVVAAILGLAIAYIITQKKKGARCIGCPHSASCGKKKECNCHD